jgi:hypothetical protein
MKIDIKQKSEKNLENFKTSTIEEIHCFNPQLNEQYLIQTIQSCPFTNLLDISTLEAFVVNFLIIQDSKFNLSFCYVNNYGLDCYVSLDDVKIIKKLK